MSTLFPVEKGVVSQNYNEGGDFYPQTFGTSTHGAWDIVSFHGDKLRLAKDGTIINVYGPTNGSVSKGFGFHLLTTPDFNGLCEQWFYWHTMSNLCVKEGQEVKQGDLAGYEGDSGQVYVNGKAVPDDQKGKDPFPGTHVHWAYRQLQQTKIPNGKYLLTKIDNSPYVDGEGNYYEILNFNNNPTTFLKDGKQVTVTNRGLLNIALRTDLIYYDEWLTQKAIDTAIVGTSLSEKLPEPEKTTLRIAILNFLRKVGEFLKNIINK